jgi:hypothetical protein
MDVPLEQEWRAGVPEIVEGYPGQTRTLEERHKGPLAQVGRVYETATFASKHKVLVLVQAADP